MAMIIEDVFINFDLNLGRKGRWLHLSQIRHEVQILASPCFIKKVQYN